MNFRGYYAILALTVALIMIMPSAISHAQATSDSGTIRVNEQTKVTLSGHESTDPQGFPLTYLWQQTAGETVKVDSTTNPTITFTTPAVAAGQVKMLTFELTVDNGHGRTDYTTLNVVVQHVNLTPVVVMGKDVTVMEGDPVTISGIASDADGDSLTYSWGQYSGPLVTLPSDTYGPTLSFTAPMVSPQSSQKLLFLLEATDPYGAKGRGQIEVTVLSKASQAVSLACADITARQGDQVTLAPIITNPGSNQVPAYFFSQISGPPVFFTPGSLPNPTFTVPPPIATKNTPSYLAGQLQFVLSVNDGITFIPQCYVNVNIAQPVSAAGAPPVANAGPDKTVEHNELVTLDGTASTGDNLQYSWQQTSGDTVQIVAGNTPQPKFVAPDVAPGETKTLTFQLTVSNENGKDNASVTITVENPINGPTAKITVVQ